MNNMSLAARAEHFRNWRAIKAGRERRSRVREAAKISRRREVEDRDHIGQPEVDRIFSNAPRALGILREFYHEIYFEDEG